MTGLPRVLGLAASGLLLPPLLVGGAVFCALLLAGFPRTDALGVFGHLLGADLEVGVSRVPPEALRAAGADAAFFEEASRELDRLGFTPDALLAVRRGGYATFAHVHRRDEGGPVLAFLLQTVYPGAPPPSVHFWSACEGPLRFVETADEIEPEEDGGRPPFLRLLLDPALRPEELLARHGARLPGECAEGTRDAPDADALAAFLRLDRSWWFEHCAADLVGMTRACPQPEPPPADPGDR